MASGTPQLAFRPEPYEQAYYEGLFQAADTKKTGAISGGEAVQFFSRSKLPVEVLKSVWTLADQPPTYVLDRAKFCVAVRLIQLLQNGHKGEGPNLAAPEGVQLRPAFFEGVSGATVQYPTPPPYQQQQQSPQKQQPQQQQQQQQMSMQGPMSMSGAGGRPQQPTPEKLAITPQDPFSLSPADRSRYETLFPQYAKPDGFLYGPEAVALFTKSGLSQQQLATIWNMVDVPHDNRLDKMEFAIAMHLIVCVSKKNLTLPPSLPPSLQELKSGKADGGGGMQQEPSSPRAEQRQQEPVKKQVMNALPADRQPVMQQHARNIPEPGRDSGPPPLPQQQTMSMNDMSPPLSGLQGPPPLQGVQGLGGMSISDAFEGLSTTDSSAGPVGLGAGSVNLDSTPSIQPSATFETVGSTSGRPAAFNVRPEPKPIPEVKEDVRPPVVEQPPKSVQQLAMNYKMGEADEELSKMQAVLQKLQAENISLKAQLGNLTEEEKEVHKQLGATVAEIGRLSNELSTLREEVLACKSRLSEATAELKANLEKKGVLTDLIDAETSTKEALNNAVEITEAANKAAMRSRAPPPISSNAFEEDLFGFGMDPQPQQQQQPEPTPPTADQFGEQTGSPTETSMPEPPQQNSLATTAEEPGYSNPEPNAMESMQYQVPSGMMGSGLPSPEEISQGLPPPANEPPPPSTYSYTEPPALPVGSESGFFVMGGGPGASLPAPSEIGPPPATIGNTVQQRAASATSDSGYGGGQKVGMSQAAPSLQSIEELKQKAKEAEDVAMQAERSRMQLETQAAQLREEADAAEKLARDKANQPEKKGFLGRGKKKDHKEAERLSVEAQKKKQAYLNVQAQLNDAQAVATETRHEADLLRAQAEEAEMSAAAEASMNISSPPNGHGPNPSAHSAGPYGQSTMTMPQPQLQTGGMGMFGAQSHEGYGSGYDSKVMGGGGISIPTPSGEDPYSNPF